MTVPIDHLIVFAPDLERGCDVVEQHLGARPVTGGRHPNLGTHNALLGLGPDCYLEVMAPDPRSERPLDLGRLGMTGLESPRLGTWVLRAEPIDALAARAREAGVGLGPVSAGHRDNPDGTRVTWRVTQPFVFPFGGVVPFLIAWGDTPHPGSRLPAVGELQGLAVEHPDAEGVRRAFEALEVSLPVSHGPAPRLSATIETARGAVHL
jgi:hypothetical protein